MSKDTEYKYPMWFKAKIEGSKLGSIVRFDALRSGKMIDSYCEYKNGHYFDNGLTPHTDINFWEDVTHLYKKPFSETKLSALSMPFSVEEKETSDNFITELLDEKDTSKNNGGKTDYYQIDNAPFKINDFDDFAEWRQMNGMQFNMGKIMWTFNVGRHSGTDYERDLNKIIHYAQRELLRIKR